MQEEVTETREFYQAVDHLYDSVAKLSELLEKPIWDLMDFIKIRNLMAQVKLDIEAMRSLAGTSQGFISCLNIYNQ
jgi:hypothetical protein